MIFSFEMAGSCGRPLVAKLEASIRLEKEEKEQRIALNLRQADFESLAAKIERDFETLEARNPKESQRAQEHALDMKYLRERQQPLDETC